DGLGRHMEEAWRGWRVPPRPAARGRAAPGGRQPRIEHDTQRFLILTVLRTRRLRPQLVLLRSLRKGRADLTASAQVRSSKSPRTQAMWRSAERRIDSAPPVAIRLSKFPTIESKRNCPR